MRKRLLIFAAYFFVSVTIFSVGAREPNFDGYERSMYVDMVFGTAHMPYVSRVVMPMTIRTISNITPEFARQGVENSIDRIYPVKEIMTKMGWNPDYFFEYMTGIFLMVLCLMGFMYAMRYLAGGLFILSDRVLFFLPIISIVFVTTLFAYYIYMYDFLSLFLFTLSYGLIVGRRWKEFFAVFVLLCFNKETAVILIFLLLLLYWKNNLHNKKFHLLLIVLLGIFVIIRVSLVLVYFDNPGSLIEFHLFDHNLKMYLKPLHLFQLLQLLFLFVLFFAHFKEKPCFLRKGLWLALPLFVLSIFFGYINEIRVYYDVYAVFVLLAGHTLSKLVGFDWKVKSLDFNKF